MGDAESSLADATSSLADATSSLGDAKSSLGDAKSSLGDATSSLGDATSSRRDAESSLGDAATSERAATATQADASAEEFTTTNQVRAKGTAESVPTVVGASGVNVLPGTTRGSVRVQVEAEVRAAPAAAVSAEGARYSLVRVEEEGLEVLEVHVPRVASLQGVVAEVADNGGVLELSLGEVRLPGRNSAPRSLPQASGKAHRAVGTHHPCSDGSRLTLPNHPIQGCGDGLVALLRHSLPPNGLTHACDGEGRV
jgi:hypothetical protein